MDYLPIFIDVRDRLVVVVGGGVVACRKVEHLLKAHARVRIVAPELDPRLRAPICELGRIEHRSRSRSRRSSSTARRSSIAATDDEAVNDAVARAARERGIWVNVVDDARALGVHLSGHRRPLAADRRRRHRAAARRRWRAACARRSRRCCRERLGELADFAGRWREAVKTALPQLPQRLRFWDGFFDGPVAARRARREPAAMRTRRCAWHWPKRAPDRPSDAARST